MEIRTLRYFLAVAREEVISGDSIPEAGISLFFFLHRANSIRFASLLSFPRIWLSNLVIVESAEAIPIINGIMLAIVSTYFIIEMPRYPEISRSSHNYKILVARMRIAKDLGIMDKDIGIVDILKDDYKGE